MQLFRNNMTIINIQNIRLMQRWLSGQYRNFRQKLTGWRYNQQYFYKNLKPVDFEQFSFFVCTAIEAVKENDELSISRPRKKRLSISYLKSFSPCRLHCWLRRRRRPGWRRTWSTLFRASATSKKFRRVPPAFEAWGTP